MSRRTLSAGVAFALLLSNAGQAQAREGVASKASVSPSAKAKLAPQVLPAKTNPPSKDAESRAYSDMVDDVAASADDFADDNTTENQGRDHLADPSAETPMEDTGPKFPAAARKGKAP